MAKRKKPAAKSNRPKNFDIHELINSLTGTCNSIDEALSSMAGCEKMRDDDLTEFDHNAISAEIFRCETCSWWYERCEETDDPDFVGDDVCANCQPYNEEDED